MKKSVIIFLLTFSALNASNQVIDERYLDLFFANGIKTNKGNAPRTLSTGVSALLTSHQPSRQYNIENIQKIHYKGK